MPGSAADLEALKAKLADAVKKPITYTQLVPLQAELDAADAARYHDDGSLPETDNVALIDECYGERGGRERFGRVSRSGVRQRERNEPRRSMCIVVARYSHGRVLARPSSAPGTLRQLARLDVFWAYEVWGREKSAEREENASAVPWNCAPVRRFDERRRRAACSLLLPLLLFSLGVFTLFFFSNFGVSGAGPNTPRFQQRSRTERQRLFAP